jgi:hypothetical protein
VNRLRPEFEEMPARVLEMLAAAWRHGPCDLLLYVLRPECCDSQARVPLESLPVRVVSVERVDVELFLSLEIGQMLRIRPVLVGRMNATEV